MALVMTCALAACTGSSGSSAADTAGAQRDASTSRASSSVADVTSGIVHGGVPGGDATIHQGPPHDTVQAASATTWDLQLVTQRLQAKGLNPVLHAGEVRQPFMSVAGARVGLAAGEATELQVFLYGDPVARARDTDPLDPARVAPATMMITWKAPPTLIVDNNVALILLTPDRTLRTRVIAAFAPGLHGPVTP